LSMNYFPACSVGREDSCYKEQYHAASDGMQ